MSACLIVVSMLLFMMENMAPSVSKKSFSWLLELKTKSTSAGMTCKGMINECPVIKNVLLGFICASIHRERIRVKPSDEWNDGLALVQETQESDKVSAKKSTMMLLCYQ